MFERLISDFRDLSREHKQLSEELADSRRAESLYHLGKAHAYELAAYELATRDVREAQIEADSGIPEPGQ